MGDHRLSLSPLCYTSRPAKRPLLSSSPSQAPAAGNSCWDPGPGCSAASQRAVPVPWLLLQLLQWYFRQRCLSGETGREKPFQCQQRDLLRAPVGMRSLTAASLPPKPSKHQQIPCNLSGNERNRSSWWKNISSLCPKCSDTPAALQGASNCCQHFY